MLLNFVSKVKEVASIFNPYVLSLAVVPHIIMKLVFLIFLSFSTMIGFGQLLPNDFIIGNFFEVFKTDSVKIYFNCTGTVVDRNCATYCRVGRMDSIDINITGKFQDCDIEGRIVLKASMVSNFLEGRAEYFYKNGQIKEEGEYRRDLREGKWTYYYSDGSVEKVLNFTEGEPIVVAYFSKKGKPKVVDGNGYFRTEFSGFRQCQPFEAWGEVKNGKRNGKWIFYNPAFNERVATEVYQEGLFIKGSDEHGQPEYGDQPKISLKKFYANENLHMEENLLGCPGNSILPWKYNGKVIHASFYPSLQNKLNDYEFELKNQWVIVGIQVNDRDDVSDVKISSSIDDSNFENFIFKQILEMKGWESAKINEKRTSRSIFFTILVRDNTVLIPTDYIYNNRKW